MSQQLSSTSCSLPIALMRAREGVMIPICEWLTDTSIPEQQWRVIRVLYDSGTLDTKTLADRANLLFPGFTRIATTPRNSRLITQTRNELDQRIIIENAPNGQKEY